MSREEPLATLEPAGSSDSAAALAAAEWPTAHGDVGEASAPASTDAPVRGRPGIRTRMISFRVTDREFEQLRERSEAEGARSISDFARSALCEQGRAGGGDLQRLNQEVQRLNLRLTKVTELIEGRVLQPAIADL